MKAHYKTQTQSGRILFEVDGQTPFDLFRGIARIEQGFDADATCGCCNSSNIGHRVRISNDNEFPELYCKDCTAALGFHQTRVGGNLYVTDEERKSPNRGWKIWKGRTAAPGAEQPEPKDEEVPF